MDRIYDNGIGQLGRRSSQRDIQAQAQNQTLKTESVPSLRRKSVEEKEENMSPSMDSNLKPYHHTCPFPPLIVLILDSLSDI